jgi:hypothetical protein
MAVTQYSVTLATTGGLVVTPASLTAAGLPVGVANPSIPDRLTYPYTTTTITIQNVDAAATVYLGNSSAVSSTSYGLSIPFGASVTLDGLYPTEPLYAVSSVASSKVNVLGFFR